MSVHKCKDLYVDADVDLVEHKLHTLLMHDMYPRVDYHFEGFLSTLMVAPPLAAVDEYSVPPSSPQTDIPTRHNLRCSTVDHERNLLPLMIVHWVRPLLLFDDFREATNVNVLHHSVVIIFYGRLTLPSA